jgi:hypothetical protein
MKRIILLITFSTFYGILFAQQPPDSCLIIAPQKLEKEGCGEQQIHVRFESACPILDLEIAIYNRYTSNQLDHLWQAKEKNPGTYLFTIKGTFANGSKIDQNGFFNLL